MDKNINRYTDRYICIHGHFYQPSRENPWIEEVDFEESSYPYHDWNSKITAECYAPNSASPIIGKDNKIIDVVNNYSKISFDFGPTLLRWLEKNDPPTYKLILEADKISQELFSGHGSAIAQAYNHIIMPLASYQDKVTQVIWGLEDFEYHFKRKPEGMWLPETAVDLETLDILAQQGVKFTILSPAQVKRVRKIGEKIWVDLATSGIDPRIPYICNLPSGRKISIFFYNQSISSDVSFGNLLKNGEEFAKRLLATFSEFSQFCESGKPQLTSIATDGETYGHHHPFGDMALAYCMYYIQSHNLATITNYAEFLEKYPPAYEVEIIENSSWSCAHGIERWRNDCGCNLGIHPEWNQKWRSPLRKAMDWLKDGAEKIYQKNAPLYFKDFFDVRNRYIRLILVRTDENIEEFLAEHSLRELNQAEKIEALKLLELQRYSMLMFTSCAWYFDDISGLQTIYSLLSAARVIQLSREIEGIDFEPGYLEFLETARSNLKEFRNGAEIYRKYVKPRIMDLTKIGTIYALCSLLQTNSDTKNDTSNDSESDLKSYKPGLPEKPKQYGQLNKPGSSAQLGKPEKPEKLESYPPDEPYKAQEVESKRESSSNHSLCNLYNLCNLYCYRVKSDYHKNISPGKGPAKKKLIVGKIDVRSNITLEEASLVFATLASENLNIVAKVASLNASKPKPDLKKIFNYIEDSFVRGDINNATLFMDKYLGKNNYTLDDLPKDKKIEITNKILRSSLSRAKEINFKIFNNLYPSMKKVKEMGIPLFESWMELLEFVVTAYLDEILENKEIGLEEIDKLKILISEIKYWPVKLNKTYISQKINKTISKIERKLFEGPENINSLTILEAMIKMSKEIGIIPDLLKAQNTYFIISRQTYPEMVKRAEIGDRYAVKWVESFKTLNDYFPAKTF